jgi:hypothetical protein
MRLGLLVRLEFWSILNCRILTTCFLCLDTSKVLEPPETPAPVFAMRAFKSALFGTPGIEEEDKESE